MAKSTKSTKAKANTPDAQDADTGRVDAQFEGTPETGDVTQKAGAKVEAESTAQDADVSEDQATESAAAADDDEQKSPDAAIEAESADAIKAEATQDDGDDASANQDALDVTVDDETVDAAEDAHVAPEPDQPTEPAVVTREVVVERKGGVVPMLIGGVVAAAIGVGASGYIFPDGAPFGPARDAPVDYSALINEQAQKIDDLAIKLADQPVVDLSPVDAAVTAVADAQSQIEALSDTLDGLNARIVSLENAPAPQASGSAQPVVAEVDLSGVTSDIDAIKSQIATLEAALDEQEGALAKMLDQVQAEKQSAEQIARTTAARTAVTQILVALESGAAFEDALDQLAANSDAAVPDALVQAAAEGIPTAASLQTSFPDAARDALSAARTESSDNSVGGFLSRQLGVRSTQPREGNDPDAVLSRMEAAVGDGRLEDALTDMEALPDAAKAPLAQWAEMAQLRLTAAREAEALATSLNSQ